MIKTLAPAFAAHVGMEGQVLAIVQQQVIYWFAILVAINLQTSFLTPPFGFALFYLRGVAPPEVSTRAIYRGVIPFVAIQIAALALLALFPAIATWLPGQIYGN